MGLLDQQAQQITANEWSATNAQSTGYEPTQYNNTPTLEAETYQANMADAAKFDMTTNDSTGRNGVAEDRLNKMIGRDSEYMQLAKANATRRMADRGLQNSNLAVGANYAAGISAALPVVQQDASAFNEIGMANTNAENQFGLANQAAGNRALSENASAENNANTWNATAEDTANKLNQQYDNQANMFEAESANQFALQNKDAIDAASRDFAAAKNTASIQNAANNLKLILAGAEEELSQYGTDIQRKTALDNIASTLIQSGVNSGVFATQGGAANWIKMIGQMYPDMGLSVTTQLATTASSGVQ